MRLRFDREKVVKAYMGNNTPFIGLDTEIETVPTVPGEEEVVVNIVPVHPAYYQYRRGGLFCIPIESMDELAKTWVIQRGLLKLDKGELDRIDND